jgi:Raf kinase inhibitor-like YbhB/YbcL family protein
MIRAAMIFVWAALLAFTLSCTTGGESSGKKSSSARKPAKSQGAKAMTIKITSSAFKDGEAIPKRYTGEGIDVSPPLEWSDVPEKAKELVLICDDPDAPTDEPWVHWVIYKIPASVKGLKEDVPRKPRLTEPAGALQGKNSWPHDNIGYRGPMPPPGRTHHYYFKLYALEAKLTVEPGMDKKVILQEIEDHVIAEGQLMGTYKR